MIVAKLGEREWLWDRRAQIAAELGHPLGMFDEAPWQAPYTFIALYDGPTKVDLFFHDGDPEPDPWLPDGVVALVDKSGVADRLATAEPEPLDMRELDAHAWDWLWWLHVKLRRGESWLVWIESTLFLQTIVVRAWNELSGDPWHGATALAERLDPDLAERAEAALPRSLADDELRRAIASLAHLYVEARTQLGAELDDALMNQVLPVISAM